MKRVKVVAGISLIIVAALILAACPAKDAAVAVNRYGTSLSAFQDAVQTAHDQGAVDDVTYRKLLNDEKLAAKAGQDLDAAITIASQGGDYTEYITSAEASFGDLVNAIRPTNSQGLLALAKASGDLLENAISLIRSIKGAPPSKPSPLGNSLAVWLLGLGVFGMAIQLPEVLQLLALASALEKPAFDLVVKLATSLKGQTTDQVLALNEQIFGKVEATADAELAKLDAAGK